MEKNPNQRSRRPPEKEKEWRALQEIAQPLGEPERLDPLLDRIGEAKYVLLGEASHGLRSKELGKQALAHEG